MNAPVIANSVCSAHGRALRMIAGVPNCVACLAASCAGATQMLDSLAQRMAGDAHESRVKLAGVPDKFLTSTFDTFIPPTPRAERLVSNLRDYCARFESTRTRRSGFIFIGPPGTAKTHLACAMVNMLATAGFSPMYTSLPRLTREIRSTYGRQGAMPALIKKLIDADLLVLDEVDLHGSSDADYGTLYDVINSRYERGGQPTLAISNREVDTLTADLDERIVSRLLEGNAPSRFDWPTGRVAPAVRQARAGGQQ